MLLICILVANWLNSLTIFYIHELSFLGGIPTDTKSALSYISTIFPSEKFNNRLPPIVMRHQIYAFVKNRTQVDRELVRYAIKIFYLYS